MLFCEIRGALLTNKGLTKNAVPPARKTRHFARFLTPQGYGLQDTSVACIPGGGGGLYKLEFLQFKFHTKFLYAICSVFCAGIH